MNIITYKMKGWWTEEPKKFLFVHVPKTAGSSINHVLKRNDLNTGWKRDKEFNFHDPLFSLERRNPEALMNHSFKFTVVRNPFTRTYSCYQYFNKVNKEKVSFSDYLHFARVKKFPDVCGDVEFWRTPMLFYPQTFFLYNMEGKIGVDKIYKYEDLSPLKKMISKRLKRKMDLPHMNHAKKEGYYESYTEENINIVREIFSIDFLNFNYSLKFNE